MRVVPLCLWSATALLLGACAGSAPLAPRAVALNQLGVHALNDGDLATAEARFAVALEYHPRFVEALVNLGLTELARGNHARAKLLFHRARAINSDLPHPHHGLGVLADKEQHPAEAIAQYREALKVDPGFVPSRTNLARDYFAASMLDDAREQFLRLSEVAPHEEQGPAGLAETLLRMGRNHEAYEVVAAAHARLGNRPALLLLIARQLLDQGSTQEARELFAQLSTWHDASATAAKAWLSIADLASGDTEAAITHAEEALSIDRHESIATYALAAALEAQADPSAPAWRARVRILTQGRVP